MRGPAVVNSKTTRKNARILLQYIRSKSALLLGGVCAFIVAALLRVNFTLPFLFILGGAYLTFIYKDRARKPYTLLNLSLLFVIIFVAGFAIIHIGWPIFYIPFCAVAMLATMLFNELVVSLLLIVVASVSLALLANNDLFVGILFLSSGILSSLLVLGARRRNTIIRAGFIIGIMQALLWCAINHFSLAQPQHYLLLFVNGIVCSVIVLGVLPIFEYLFKTITDVSLLELADFNQPLLNRMMLEAPGTYHHSLIVGNLSDAACKAIGANALLARIGAYYHDVGKLQKPEYFSENQGISSKHDTLSASMSKLVIMNHVKEGVDIAKQYKLNARLIDFIQFHHGDSLVYYFYRRALENLEEDQEVKEEGFRYPGPKPNSKETAIVMLADSVEAAARALKDSSPSKIEEVVHKIVNNKFTDRQLDQCELTLKDLEMISSVFIRILNGIYHSRVNYPEPDAKNILNLKKSAKDASPQSQEDKKNSP